MKRVVRERATEQTDLQARAAALLAKRKQQQESPAPRAKLPATQMVKPEVSDNGVMTHHQAKAREERMYITVRSYGPKPIWFDAYAIIREQLQTAARELNEKIGDGTRIYIELVYTKTGEPVVDYETAKREKL